MCVTTRGHYGDGCAQPQTSRPCEDASMEGVIFFAAIHPTFVKMLVGADSLNIVEVQLEHIQLQIKGGGARRGASQDASFLRLDQQLLLASGRGHCLVQATSIVHHQSTK